MYGAQRTSFKIIFFAKWTCTTRRKTRLGKMIKIDLHVHTVASVSDAHFDFCLDRLKEYVTKRKINCIAITNHNLFDRNQFEQIRHALSITVLPGIEIDLAEGQILVIADGSDLDDFSPKCQLVSNICQTNRDRISIEQFKDFFADLSDYILIPHYEKKPRLSDQTLEKLMPHVTAGEVTNPKKFVYCLKDKGRLVPVYFSDFRSSANTTLPFRQTYLGCKEVSFSAVKNCLRDKSKVSLSPVEGKSYFQIFDDGQELSTGLNVIIGERSTGKSYTLNRICTEFPNARYIKQFSLVARDEEGDEKKFNKILSDKHSLLSREYLEEFQSVVLDVIHVDIEEDVRSIEKYLSSLMKYAKESERHDSFSKAKLYSEEKFQILKLEGLQTVINSTENLVKNVEFRQIIDGYIDLTSLKALYVHLMQEYVKREEERRKRGWLNDLMKEVKDKLQLKTAVTKIEDVELYDVAMNLSKIEKFKDVATYVRRARDIERRSLKGFEIVARAECFTGAGELKKLSRLTSGFGSAFQQYNNPYKFLQELKNISGLQESEFHKYFVNIHYKILNKDGFEVSGGERSEFNLLQELENAKEYDMLLIDEPESSFDNIFLKEEVNEHIKDISNDMPVILVTHNNTVGASICPDYLLCTRKEIVEGEIQYRIYSGCPTDKNLMSRDGKSLKTWDVLLGCLEAGELTYNERRRNYEDLKD